MSSKTIPPKKKLPRFSARFRSEVSSLDWECREVDTRYLTHPIHRYSGKFIPQIAKNAIQLLSRPGDVILDPYCGSGTTLLEAALCGRRAIGIDLNPLAALISRVKVAPMASAKLDEFLQRMNTTLEPLREPGGCLDLFIREQDHERLIEDAKSDARWRDPWFAKWFPDSVRLELMTIARALESESNRHLREIGLVAFSDILRKSSRANQSYPNVMFDRHRIRVEPATRRFLARLNEVALAVKSLADMPKRFVVPKVYLRDAGRTRLPSESIDAVVTHPPYIGSIPYAEYGALSLKWLGHDPRSLDRALTGGVRQSKDVVDRFREGFAAMLHEAFRVLKPQGSIFLLLGRPTVKGQIQDLPLMAQEIALDAGFLLLSKDERRGHNRRSNQMGSEALLFFQKPATSALP